MPTKPHKSAKAAKSAKKPETGARRKPGTSARQKPVVDKKPPAAKSGRQQALVPKAQVQKKPEPKRSVRPAEAAKVETRSQLRLPAKPLNGAKSPYSITELREWRSILLERRHEIVGDIAGLEKDAIEAEDGHTTPTHPAERGSDADLQDMSLGLAGEEKDLLWQIDRALRKIDLGRPLPFGLCEHTHEPIGKDRLKLMPWTPLSIKGATFVEENGLTVEDVLLDD